MFSSPRLFLLLSLLCPAVAVAASPAAQPWVAREAGGRLSYRADERGNTIPDFSRAGYGGGGVALPNVPVVVTLQPGAAANDDGARIQAALDQVAARPADAQGFRGAVLLRAGTYRVGGHLALRAGGVVLRGEGDGENGTVIVATGTKQRTLIEIGDASARMERREPPRRVTDEYVPWSSFSLTVASAEGLAVGDRVIIDRPSTAEWITVLEMDRIKLRPNAPADSTKQWKAGEFDLRFERTITAIQGRRLTFDAPVMNALEARYGGATVYRYTLPRIRECGVEHLRLVSTYERGKETSDENHAWTGIELKAVENAWVRNVTVLHFSHGVEAEPNSLFVTIQDSHHLDPVSQITGGRRYSFSLNGQYGLVQRCHARGARHVFVTGSRVRGPNVFLDGTAVQSHADSGPHHRWAVGTLYDNISDDYQLRVQDRQYAGSGHGWTGAQQVLWNCTSKSIVVQQPPTGQNWAIGCVGEIVPGSWAPDRPLGAFESHGRRVEPRSLYLAQLEARLGPAARSRVASSGTP